LEAALYHAGGQAGGRTDGRTDGRKDKHDRAGILCSQFCECANKKQQSHYDFFFSWRYNPPVGVVFYSPLAGFSLLAYEVS